MVSWSSGLLLLRSPGPLVLGPLVPWSPGLLVLWSPAPPVPEKGFQRFWGLVEALNP